MSEKIFAGIDEAGRGPLAGRVYAACVILDKNKKIQGLRDSKKLSESKRNILYQEIKEKSLSYGIAYAEPQEIDEINILRATFLAMKRAVEKINVEFDYIFVDGNIFPFKNQYEGEAVVKGDDKIEEIMAASILAKVERDAYMLEMNVLYPEYSFDKHKGYPTKLHSELIKKFGVTPIHRKTFCKVKEFI
ncbi:MAG TPA: ribonuclease HII [Spirochaetota bacterium]|nr:ribonuclease HII [Spirochaetota bacterium]